jgi:hypothetical protein
MADSGADALIEIKPHLKTCRTGEGCWPERRSPENREPERLQSQHVRSGPRGIFPGLWQEILKQISTGNSYRGKRVARWRITDSPFLGWRRLQLDTESDER